MIISATTLDASLLTAIAIKSKGFWGYKKDLLDSWKEDLTVTKTMIQNQIVFKLISNSKIVGFYILSNPKKHRIELEFLFVLPNFIGKNFGNQLIKHAIAKAISLNVKTITLLADPNAVAFYKSKGFKIIDKRESAIKDRFLPVMELNLTSTL